ncbi:hypothetical protein UF75_0480 [Desulfosporosinus sp. I2]|nr:hypothetical protein UF75_0480 [Desulfosporosinus sp. I2]
MDIGDKPSNKRVVTYNLFGMIMVCLVLDVLVKVSNMTPMV